MRSDGAHLDDGREPTEAVRWKAAFVWGGVNVTLFLGFFAAFALSFVPRWPSVHVVNASPQPVVVVPIARSWGGEAARAALPFRPRSTNTELGLVAAVAHAELEPGEEALFWRWDDRESGFDALVVSRGDGTWGRLVPESSGHLLGGTAELTVLAPDGLPDALDDERALARRTEQPRRPTLRTLAQLATLLFGLRCALLVATFRSPRRWLVPSAEEFIATVVVFVATLAGFGIAISSGV